MNSIVEVVFCHAAVEPEKLCLADDTSKITYRGYTQKIRRYASCFVQMVFASGTLCWCKASQTIEYLAMQLGLQLIGAVFVLVENKCTPGKILDFAQRVNAKAVVSVKEIADAGRTCITYEQMVENNATAEPLQPKKFLDAADVAEILFSTGTTGKEKSIALTNRTILH